MQWLSLEPAVLEVKDLGAMAEAVERLLGLKRLVTTPTGVTFELAASHRASAGNPPQVMMLVAGVGPYPPRTLSLEVDSRDYATLRQRLITAEEPGNGVTSWESDNSLSPGCAWRVIWCRLPEGHRLRIAAIDPRRCGVATAPDRRPSQPT
ncbi:hypothetical protein ACUN9Y_17345 [Halomonas sp. V046]|uniref:hypothetical protein n=1 Tax=Halomonas sp. V046 TaxID=3459611 RepID=UPI004044679D